MPQKPHPHKTAQQGITLIEALIALLILALGVLGLAAVEARMLAETRTTNSRATAIRLIADLGDRVRLNAWGAQPANNSSNSGLSAYADSSAAPPTFPVSAATALSTAAPAACTNPSAAAGCGALNLAVYDRWFWRREVASQLMNGQASIFQVSPQQLQIIVAWQANENTNATLTGTPSAADRLVADQLQITNGSGTGLCPVNWICHVDFIDIPN